MTAIAASTRPALALRALREHDLEDVAAPDVLLRDLDAALVLGLVGEAEGLTRADGLLDRVDRRRERARDEI